MCILLQRVDRKAWVVVIVERAQALTVPEIDV
jgi:hypothetical protein